jgi:hypothetical protein
MSRTSDAANLERRRRLMKSLILKEAPVIRVVYKYVRGEGGVGPTPTVNRRSMSMASVQFLSSL